MWLDYTGAGLCERRETLAEFMGTHNEYSMEGGGSQQL